MFNFINIYSFIPVSGCVDMGPSAMLCQGAYNAVKIALNIYAIIINLYELRATHSSFFFRYFMPGDSCFIKK